LHKTFITDRGRPYTDTPFVIPPGILKSSQPIGDDPNLCMASNLIWHIILSAAHMPQDPSELSSFSWKDWKEHERTSSCPMSLYLYVAVALRNHGLMQTPPKIQQKKRKASAPSGSAAKRHGHARPVSPGPVPVGRVPAKRMQCSDATQQTSGSGWFLGCW